MGVGRRRCPNDAVLTFCSRCFLNSFYLFFAALNEGGSGRVGGSEGSGGSGLAAEEPLVTASTRLQAMLFTTTHTKHTQTSSPDFGRLSAVCVCYSVM